MTYIGDWDDDFRPSLWIDDVALMPFFIQEWTIFRNYPRDAYGPAVLKARSVESTINMALESVYWGYWRNPPWEQALIADPGGRVVGGFWAVKTEVR